MKHYDFTDLAVPGVRQLKPYIPGKPTAELEREYGVSNSIKLASNENPLGASPRAIEAIRGELDDLWLYPDANGFELKQALAARHGVDPSCITLGNGSNDVLVFLAQVFLQPGLEAVFSQYCFAVYPIATQMVGATAKVAPALPADHVMPLGHDLRALYERVGPDTRLVMVANPNNPTGTWLDGARLKDFVASLPPHVICVVDEAYTEYAESDRLGDASTWLDECPNLVVTRTFSKAYGLAGLRVGYALSNPGISDLLNRVRPAFNVNSLALTAARAALDDQAFIDHSREVNSAGLVQLGEGLGHLGARVVPSAANFVLAEFDRSGAELNEQLLRAGIIVRPVANYGLENYLRITVGTEAQNQRVLAALGTILGQSSGQ
ncbi:MAG: histidinol-phosphate transaminase [Wenzhouxiangella sp.]